MKVHTSPWRVSCLTFTYRYFYKDSETYNKIMRPFNDYLEQGYVPISTHNIKSLQWAVVIKNPSSDQIQENTEKEESESDEMRAYFNKFGSELVCLVNPLQIVSLKIICLNSLFSYSLVKYLNLKRLEITVAFRTLWEKYEQVTELLGQIPSASEVHLEVSW